MSIQSEINRISSEVTTQTDLLGQIAAELAGKAAGGGGIVPSGQISITSNGTYNVTNYAQAVVDVPTGADPNMMVAVITPSAEAQTVYPDEGMDGFYYAYVHGDEQLVPENVKSGVNIFGVTGTYTGSGGTGSGPYSKAQIITWTPSSDTNTMSIAHSLGVVPDGFFVIPKADLSDLQETQNCVVTLNMDVNMKYMGVYYFVTGVATPEDSQQNGFDAILYIITNFDADITAQSVSVAMDKTFKGGVTYEILVYKR